jgi:hypothetical protein
MANIIDISKGRILISSDIQGNFEDYKQIRYKIFKELGKQGIVDYLVFDGDLIHGYSGYKDESKRILDDLIDNSDRRIIPLMGNHEFMHLYHLNVQKAGRSFVWPFEEEIKENRPKYIKFIISMPYAIRTLGGVTINHTGANRGMGDSEMQPNKWTSDPFELMNTMVNHNHFLKNLEKFVLRSEVGASFEKYYPQIGIAFMNLTIGKILWDIFFNKNELEYGSDRYNTLLCGFLKTMGKGNLPQRFLVTGHIEVPEGYKVLFGKQLRISSSYGAQDTNKVLALVDASRKYSSVDKLVDDLVAL